MKTKWFEDSLLTCLKKVLNASIIGNFLFFSFFFAFVYFLYICAFYIFIFSFIIYAGVKSELLKSSCQSGWHLLTANMN